MNIQPQHEQELLNLKRWRPYMIVWGMYDKDTGEWFMYAKPTKHLMNKKLREGHTIFII